MRQKNLSRDFMKTVKDKQKLNYAIITKWFESILSLNSASKWKDVEIVTFKKQPRFNRFLEAFHNGGRKSIKTWMF